MLRAIARLLRNLTLSSNRSRRNTGRGKKNANVQLALECLENRLIPAVTANFNAPLGILTVTGDSANNRITVSESNGSILLNGRSVGGKPTLANTSEIIILGLKGNDTITLHLPNFAGKATLDGGDGNDVLEGGVGDQVLIGGKGNDTYRFAATNKNEVDTVIEFAGQGVDTLDFSALARTNPVAVNLTNDAALAKHANRLVLTGVGQAVNLENVTGGAGDDRIIGNKFANKLTGNGGIDTLFGGGGADTLSGEVKLTKSGTPVSRADQFTAEFNTTVMGNVLANDTDPDGDALIAVLVSSPANSKSFVFHSDGTFVYAPNATFSGTDSFTHQTKDAFGVVSTTTKVTITIKAAQQSTPYEGTSPVTAMIRHQDGVLTAFANCEGNPNLYRVHWSADGNNLGSGQIVYEGISPVLAMVSYRGGVLTAFSNCDGNPNLYRVHWSPDGKNLGKGEIVYEGFSPVTAMTAYQDGILTAFANCEGNPNLFRVHWSSNGKDLGSGEIRYQGSSPVDAMVAYQDGVLTAFSRCAGDPNLYRVHWSDNGYNLGSGPIRYEGVSPVTAMTVYNGGVMTAFANSDGNPNLYRIHFSENGEGLGSGAPKYEGISPVDAMTDYKGEVLAAFSNCAGDPALFRVHRSAAGNFGN